MTGQTELESLRNEMLLRLNKHEVRPSSYKVAEWSLKFYRDVMTHTKAQGLKDLIETLKHEGDFLYSRHRGEFIIRNMLCATLKVFREEAQKIASGTDDLAVATDSLNKLWIGPNVSEGAVDPRKLRKSVVAAIDELKTELETSHDNLAAQAPHHVLSSDTIMTHKFSTSQTLREFFTGTMCCLLSVDDESPDPKLKANVISSTEILSAMSTVNRVVLSAVAVLPDGSCIAQAGALNICLAAKRHSVPVLVCAAFYKFTPVFLPTIEEYNSQSAVTNVMPFGEAFNCQSVQVVSPVFEKIPAQLISLYITQTSAVSPSHLYRLIGEYYHPEDFHLFSD